MLKTNEVSKTKRTIESFEIDLQAIIHQTLITTFKKSKEFQSAKITDNLKKFFNFIDADIMINENIKFQLVKHGELNKGKSNKLSNYCDECFIQFEGHRDFVEHLRRNH